MYVNCVGSKVGYLCCTDVNVRRFTQLNVHHLHSSRAEIVEDIDEVEKAEKADKVKEA